jgi:hypothetical protein
MIGLVVCFCGRSESNLAADAWEKAASFFPNESMADFKQLGGDLEDGPREARFGYAVSLLSATPSTKLRLDEAEQIFSDLSATGNDDYGLGARFLLGRLTQIYRSPSDPTAAAEHFRWLVENHPESRWGQIALTKLAMVLVYTLPGAGTPAERIAEGRKLLDLASIPDSRRDINMILASAHFHYKLEPTDALPFLIAAEAGGNLDVGTRSDVLVRIGELMVLDGRKDEAIEYYQKFVDDFYGAARRYAVQQKSLELQEGRDTIP